MLLCDLDEAEGEPAQDEKDDGLDKRSSTKVDKEVEVDNNHETHMLSKPQPNLNTRLGLAIKWLCKHHPPHPT